ncbi:zinc finger protein DZIP1L isoform X1 [Apis mellifera carnica]|nr:zinc finger protein DZIP1L isoform X1 [Apis mellifera carnica]
MAFSFRIGTKWCHDFPKLAKESGFYFNMHRSRIRVDWNRISNIDIDRIIKERDFHSIDENINNVIDYCLESEYDVKILDPNFVKLFCLAQLAVEYLLYCKQYLDHSVMILKDELKLKIEENAKLKKEIATLEEIMKHVKEKVKEKSKLIETKIGDTNGEIYKCPHCPKSFISSMFVSAHIIRRHTHTSDLYMSVSPIHEHYRNETEKLHNEIKNLKERLNETEKVIRNESENICDKKILNYNKKQTENEIENVKYDNNKSKEHLEYKEYQEEIKNLKIMLFDEIHNLRQKENIMYERTSETNVQALISQQEKEFQKLKNQLFDKFTPDIESMHTKLYDQENYWKSKIEQLENQHHKDIERLTIELKLTQTAADDMKAKYEAKVNDLERQTANQSNILIEQKHNYKSLQASLMNVFEQKLKDLGIDPEWQGIPKTTFKQKMDILKHHHKLAVKKLPKYHQIKLRIIEEVLNKISKKEKITENMKQFKKLSLHRPIIKELSDQQNPEKKISFLDSHISKLQAITLNEYYSTPEIKDSVKNIIENVSLPIKTQIANYKTVEELIDISPNSIKSLESVQDATNLQEFLIKKDFLNEIKPVFNSETFKVISNTNTISSHKFIENNDINNSNIQQELQNIFISPKHNKSVLKSTSGSTNSLIKKKVIFDLTNKKDKESYSDDDKEKKELYENTLSNSDEQKYLSQLEDYKNSSNIILKTAQSDKIAELSKKLEIQLNMVRQKPIGSVETIFSSKYIQNKKNQNKSIEQITPTSISSFVINPVQTSLSYSKKPNDLLPQPASYNLTDKISEILHAESVSEISDLDSDIDKILKLE